MGVWIMLIPVYSRIVGYYSPVHNWHDGKRQEFKERKKFDRSIEVEKPMGRWAGVWGGSRGTELDLYYDLAPELRAALFGIFFF